MEKKEWKGSESTGAFWFPSDMNKLLIMDFVYSVQFPLRGVYIMSLTLRRSKCSLSSFDMNNWSEWTDQHPLSDLGRLMCFAMLVWKQRPELNCWHGFHMLSKPCGWCMLPSSTAHNQHIDWDPQSQGWIFTLAFMAFFSHACTIETTPVQWCEALFGCVHAQLWTCGRVQC